MVIKVALFARVSTVEQNTDLQLDELRRVAVARGWSIVGEYVDQGVSGSKEGPERRRLMADAHRGMFEAVLVWRFDRFARSAKDLLFAVDVLASLNVGFASVRESFDTTSPIGRATLTILAAVAELERNIITERVVAGLDRAKAKGKKLGRPRREFDLDRARDMIAAGKTQRQVAMALKVPRSTLRRGLAEEHRAENPPPAEASLAP